MKSRLTPIKFHHRDKSSRSFYVYKCSYDENIFVARKDLVNSGNTESCGCSQKKQRSVNGQKNKTHGESKKTKEYTLWCNIKQRCYNINHDQFKDYGGRGIKMYEPWINSYEAFRDWIITNLKRKPGSKYSIDRINNDGNYEPGNLRWATKKQQANNKRGN